MDAVGEGGGCAAEVRNIDRKLIGRNRVADKGAVRTDGFEQRELVKLDGFVVCSELVNYARP